MAQYANGATLSVDYTKLVAGTPTYVAIGEVVDISGPNASADTLEATAHGDAWREYVPGLKDGGEVSVTFRAEAGHAGQFGMFAKIGTGPFAVKITWPLMVSTNTVNRSVAVDGILTGVGVGLPHDGLATMDGTFKVSGEPTWVEEAAI